MDAVKYLRTYREVCNSFDNCQQCSLGLNLCSDRDICPKEYVDAVEKWAKEHPQKTRQSEFLKIVPNAYTDADGNIRIYPCAVDEKLRAEKCGTGKCGNKECGECTREYWLEEIE